MLSFQDSLIIRSKADGKYYHGNQELVPQTFNSRTTDPSIVFYQCTELDNNYLHCVPLSTNQPPENTTYLKLDQVKSLLKDPTINYRMIKLYESRYPNLNLVTVKIIENPTTKQIDLHAYFGDDYSKYFGQSKLHQIWNQITEEEDNFFLYITITADSQTSKISTILNDQNVSRVDDPQLDQVISQINAQRGHLGDIFLDSFFNLLKNTHVFYDQASDSYFRRIGGIQRPGSRVKTVKILDFQTPEEQAFFKHLGHGLLCYFLANIYGLTPNKFITLKASHQGNPKLIEYYQTLGFNSCIPGKYLPKFYQLKRLICMYGQVDEIITHCQRKQRKFTTIK